MKRIITGLVCLLLAVGTLAMAFAMYKKMPIPFIQNLYPVEGADKEDEETSGPVVDLVEQPEKVIETPKEKVIEPEDSTFIGKLAAVTNEEMFSDQFEFERTAMTNPEVAYINFPSDASFLISREDNGIVTISTTLLIQSFAEEADLELAIEKVDLFKIVYEAVSQAEGNPVGAGADRYDKLVIGGGLIDAPAEKTYEAMKDVIIAKELQDDNLTLCLDNVEEGEYGISASINLTYTPNGVTAEEEVEEVETEDVEDPTDKEATE